MTHENIDKALADAFQTTEGGQDVVLVPERVSAGIRRFVQDSSPLYNIVPQEEVDGKYFEYRKLEALPSAEMVAEGAIADVSKSKYGRDVVEIKRLSTTGQVTGFAQDAVRTVMNLWLTEIEEHANAARRMLERQLVAGSIASDPLEFDGMNVQIQNSVDGEGNALTLGLLDEAIDEPHDEPTHMIVTKAMGRRIWSLLQAQQRFVDRTEVEGGFKVPVYADKPIIRLDNEAGADIANTILMPDMRHTKLAVLRDFTFERIGKVDDSDAFFIRMYAALAMEGQDHYHVKISNVLTAPAPENP